MSSKDHELNGQIKLAVEIAARSDFKLLPKELQDYFKKLSKVKPKTEPRGDSISFTLDYDDKLESRMGQLVPEGTSKYADLAYNLFKQGYLIEVGAEFISEGIDENGVHINPQLIGLSLLTHTARKRDNGFNRPDSDKATDKRKRK